MDKTKEVTSIFTDMHSSLTMTREFLYALLDQEEERLKDIEKNIHHLAANAIKLDDHNQFIAENSMREQLSSEEIEQIKNLKRNKNETEQVMTSISDIKKHLDNVKEQMIHATSK